MAQISLIVKVDEATPKASLNNIWKYAQKLEATPIKLTFDTKSLDAVEKSLIKATNAQAKYISAQARLKESENAVALAREKTKQSMEATKQTANQLATQMERTATAEEKARQANTQLSTEIQKATTEQEKQKTSAANLALQQEKAAITSANLAAQQTKTATTAGQMAQEEEKASKSFNTGTAEQQINNLSKAFSNLQNTMQNSSVKYKSGTFNDLIASAKEAATETQALWISYKEGTITQEQFGKSLEELKTKFSSVSSSFANVRANTEQLGNTVVSVGDRLSNVLVKIAKWAVGTALIYTPIRAVQSAFKELTETLIETEDAVVDLQRVLNSEDIANSTIATGLYDIAEEYGRGWADVSDVATKWAQAGYDWNDVLTLTEGTMLALNTAELDATSGTASLIAIMKQFKISAEDYQSTIDLLNKTADDYSVTTESLVSAIQRMGSASVNAKMDLQQTISVITALAEATGRAGSNLGTALNSLIVYTSKAKALDVFSSLSDNMSNVVDEYKIGAASIYDVWQQLSNEIGNLSDEQSTKLEQWYSTDDASEMMTSLESELGDINDTINDVYATSNTFRRNYFTALLSNFSTAEDALDNMSDAEGYSQNENEVYMESYTAKVSQMKDAWAAVAADADGFLSLMKGGSEVLTWLAHAVDYTGGLKTTLFVIVSLLTTLGSGAIAAGVIKLKDGFASLKGAFTGNAAKLELLNNNLDWFEAKANMALTAEERLANATEITTTKQKIQATTYATNISKIGGVITALTLAYTAYQMINSAIEAHIQKLNDAAAASAETAETAQSEAVSLRTLLSEYEALNSIQSRTADQEVEFQTVVENITTALGDKADVLEGLTAGTDAYTEALKNATAAELENANVTANTAVYDAAKALEATAGDVNRTTISKDVKGMTDDLYALLENIAGGSGPSGLTLGSFSNDAKSILEYYNQIVEAKRIMDQSATESGNDAIRESRAYKTLSSEIDRLKDSVSTYSSELDKLNKSDALLKVHNDLKAQTIDSQGAFDNYVASIENSTEYSKEFKDILLEIVNDRFPQYSNSASDAADSNDSFADSSDDAASALDTLIGKLDDAESAFKSLADAMDDFNDDGKLTYSSIKDIADKFGDVDGIDDYITKLSDANLTADDFQQTMNDLAIALIQQQVEAGTLTDDTAALTAKMLEEAGITNALELINWALANSQGAAASGATSAAEGFKKQSTAADTTKTSTDNAKISLANFGSTSIDTSGIVTQFDYVTSAAQRTAQAALITQNILANNAKNVGSGYAPTGMLNGADADAAKQKAAAKAAAEKMPEIKWGGTTGGSTGNGGGGSSKDETDPWQDARDSLDDYLDEEERAIELIQKIGDTDADTIASMQTELANLATQMDTDFPQGVIDLTVRPQVDSSAMQEAGWDVEDGSYSTVFSSSYEFEQVPDQEILLTPILPDGTVLSEDELVNYVNNILDEGGVESLKTSDVFLGIFGSVEDAETYAEKLHEVQEAYYNLKQSVTDASMPATDKAIAQYKEMQDKISDLADKYRKETGVKEDDYTRQLSLLWWDYADDIKDVYDDIAETAKKAIESISDQTEKTFDDVKTIIDEIVNGIEDEIDSLDEESDEEENLLSLEEKRLAVSEAQQDLADAQSERTVRTYNSTTDQWEWIVNAKSVKDAQDALSDAYTDLADFQKELAEEETKSELENEKSYWEDIEDQLEDAFDSITELIKKQSDPTVSANLYTAFKTLSNVLASDISDETKQAISDIYDTVVSAIDTSEVDSEKNNLVMAFEALTAAATGSSDALSYLETVDWSSAMSSASSENALTTFAAARDEKIELLAADAGETVSAYLTEKGWDTTASLVNAKLAEGFSNTDETTDAISTATDSLTTAINNAASAIVSALGSSYNAPTSTGSSTIGSSGGGSTSSNSITASSNNNDKYTIASSAGLAIADKLSGSKAGTSVTVSDGSTWTSNGNGSITITTTSGKVLTTGSYDSGGVLKGMGHIRSFDSGGVKLTNDDEVIIEPDTTAKVLNPESNKQFTNFIDRLGVLFGIAKSVDSSNGAIYSNSNTSTKNYNFYVDGIELTETRQGMTLKELAQDLGDYSLYNNT